MAGNKNIKNISLPIEVGTDSLDTLNCALAQSPSVALQQTQFLTVDQFAQILAISPQTVDEWIASGYLMPGQHYFQHNRVLRVLWGSDLLDYMRKQTIAEKAERTAVSSIPKLSNRTSKRNGQPSFDPEALN